MPDILSAAVGAFVVAVADELGHECVRHHADDMQQALNDTQQGINKSIDEGWERDHNAGGYSSWGKSNTASESA